jgi:hypothetical protein
VTWRRLALPLGLYAFGVAVFAVVAWNRLWVPSTAPHFAVQAEAWLRGELSIRPPLPPDDVAKVETVRLDDGRVVRGRTFTSPGRRGAFQTTTGEVVAAPRVTERLGTTAYMSFPPFPSVVMLPQVALSGRGALDVLTTVLIAGLVMPLLFGILRQLARQGLGPPRLVDQLVLVAALPLGTVFFFSAVQGKVWFTAHVIGVVLALGYIWCAIDARRPLLAGVLLGCAALTRTPLAFMFPLLALEALRAVGGLAAVRGTTDEARAARKRLLRTLAWFAAPVVVLAVAGMVYNAARFGSPTEFGHTYLAVRQQAQIEAHGLFSYHYLARNLTVAFTLLPELGGGGKLLQISGHGLAMWVTTPALLLLLWPRAGTTGGLHRNLWITVAFVALPTFLYQNSGWVQFGYRFSLDYMPMLFVLLALGGRTTTWLARGLIAIGVVVNLFGAVTFDRMPEYYRLGGRGADSAYDVVMPN